MTARNRDAERDGADQTHRTFQRRIRLKRSSFCRLLSKHATNDGVAVIKPHSGTALPPGGVTFERLVWISFGLALLQGALQLMPSLDVNGWAISLMKLFVSPVISLLVALAVSRLRSRIAAIVFILSLLASLVLAYLDVVEDYWRNLPFAIGATSIIVDMAAAAIISRWVVKSEF